MACSSPWLLMVGCSVSNAFPKSFPSIYIALLVIATVESFSSDCHTKVPKTIELPIPVITHHLKSHLYAIIFHPNRIFVLQIAVN